VADVAPIGLVGFSPTLMVANAQIPVKDVKDLVAQLKAKPDKYTYASAAGRSGAGRRAGPGRRRRPPGRRSSAYG
jgi:tripartite-type tricarboxylate transporter receptor subunit TctC